MAWQSEAGREEWGGVQAEGGGIGWRDVAWGVSIGVWGSALAIAVTLGLEQWSWSQAMGRRDEAVPGQIEAMRKERDWMAQEGLGRGDRRVGAITEQGRAGAHMAGYWALGPLALSPSVGDKLRGFASWRWGVAPAPAGASERPEDLGGDMGMVYRHEEAHALRFERALPAGAPSSWPAGAAATAMREINAFDRSSPANWRLQWMAMAREEAFADAYACLSAARKGRGALRECALKTHASRLIPAAKLGSGWTSLALAGNSHGVEMASFMAGQLSEAQVARLTGDELLELAGRVADESLGWALARQAPLLGFFSEAGFKGWWEPASRRWGKSEEAARAQWNQWREAMEGERPAAVFGEAAWVVGGVEFRASKAGAEQARGAWRFDGFGGLATQFGELDAETAARSERRREGMRREGCQHHLPEACKGPWWRGRMGQIGGARSAALAQHARMARLVGAGALAEARRLSRVAEGDAGMQGAIYDEFWRPQVKARAARRAPVGTAGLAAGRDG